MMRSHGEGVKASKFDRYSLIYMSLGTNNAAPAARDPVGLGLCIYRYSSLGLCIRNMRLGLCIYIKRKKIRVLSCTYHETHIGSTLSETVRSLTIHPMYAIMASTMEPKMDQAVCRLPRDRYARIAMPVELHRRIKLLAVHRNMSMIQLIDRAIDALEVVESAIASESERESSRVQGTADTVIHHSFEQKPNRHPSDIPKMDEQSG